MNDNAMIAEIAGYAAVFNKRDLNGDIVAPGAFAKTLSAGSPVRMLYQHAAETPIGRWTSFKEDARGLYAVGEILLASPRAREIHALLAGGAVDGLSIGYRTVKSEKARGAARRIIEAELWEVSVVTFPMAPGARVLTVGAPRPEDRRRAPPLARPTGRAPLIPTASPPGGPGGARQFADALRGAAGLLSGEPKLSV